MSLNNEGGERDLYPNGIPKDAVGAGYEDIPYKGVVTIEAAAWTFLTDRETFREVMREDAAKVLMEIEDYFLAEYDRRLVKRNSVRVD